MLTEGSRTMRNRPYQVLKSQVRTRVLFSMSTLSCTAFCSQGSIAEVGSGARRSRFISPTSSNPRVHCTNPALTHP